MARRVPGHRKCKSKIKSEMKREKRFLDKED